MTNTFDKSMGVILLVISILFVTESMKISGSAYGSVIGPKTYPLILGIILGFLSLRLLYETFRKNSETPEKMKLNYKRFGIILVSAILYVFLLEIIGYILATFLFLLISFWVMEKGKLLSTILIALFFTLGVYLMFVTLLGGSLPKFTLF
ncbi:tripartite tricarboxylate transporter TctB family protein [Lysinibacillus yapensis]|uniref:Tripartite tricarboxylate transporter TctB family protein n=1 Tax=Ureibacillus yapensis TaxID=2304605 RepID=A0A396SK97_9BACL|nr:tripartite tricarboxylate transporter TctB family protein [Lysinibacillus yapensis]RHW39789.1 tripartite tricarboxylate transporter TctB family protein [Lysinibacillus yapensis]